MNQLPGSGRFDRIVGDQWKLLLLRGIGTIGAVGFGIQVVLFPLIGNSTNGTVCQYCLGAVLGFPIAGLLKGSSKE